MVKNNPGPTNDLNQNLIGYSLGHIHLSTKFHQNPFITFLYILQRHRIWPTHNALGEGNNCNRYIGEQRIQLLILWSDCNYCWWPTDDFFVDCSVAVENARHVKNVTGIVLEVACLIGVDDWTLTVRWSQSHWQRFDCQYFTCVHDRIDLPSCGAIKCNSHMTYCEDWSEVKCFPPTLSTKNTKCHIPGSHYKWRNSTQNRF